MVISCAEHGYKRNHHLFPYWDAQESIIKTDLPSIASGLKRSNSPFRILIASYSYTILYVL